MGGGVNHSSTLTPSPYPWGFLPLSLPTGTSCWALVPSQLLAVSSFQHPALLSALLPDQLPLSPPSHSSHPCSLSQVLLFWLIMKVRPGIARPVQAINEKIRSPLSLTPRPPASYWSFQTSLLRQKYIFKLGLLLHTLFCKQPSWLSSIWQPSLQANKYRSTTCFLIAA